MISDKRKMHCTHRSRNNYGLLPQLLLVFLFHLAVHSPTRDHCQDLLTVVPRRAAVWIMFAVATTTPQQQQQIEADGLQELYQSTNGMNWVAECQNGWSTFVASTSGGTSVCFGATTGPRPGSPSFTYCSRQSPPQLFAPLHGVCCDSSGINGRVTMILLIIVKWTARCRMLRESDKITCGFIVLNRLRGTLPDAYHRLVEMDSFDAPYNLLSGSLPPSWSAWSKIRSFWLKAMI